MWDRQLWLAAPCPKRPPIGIQETTPCSTQGHCGDRAVVNGNTCVSTIGTRVEIYIYFHINTHTQLCIVFSLYLSLLPHSFCFDMQTTHNSLLLPKAWGLWPKAIHRLLKAAVCVWLLMLLCQHSAGLRVCVYKCVCLCVLAPTT